MKAESRSAVRAPRRADRPRWRSAAAGVVALAAAGVLAGCSGVSSSTPGSGPTASTVAATSAAPSPSASPSPTAAALTCDDLVPQQAIVQALSGGRAKDGWRVDTTSTADGLLTGEVAVRGAGGLSCSWHGGLENAEYSTAILTATVLPEAADQWTAQLTGDGPTSERRTFAGISAAAACGDPGCSASAPVGSSWVQLDLVTGSREGGGSVFAHETDDQVFAGMRPAVEAAFRTVQGASAAQLDFPSRSGSTDGAADCRTYLAKTHLEDALDIDSYTVEKDGQSSAERHTIEGVAQQRTGDSTCILLGHNSSNDFEAGSVLVAPGQASAIDRMGDDPAARGDLKPTTVDGQVSGEHALTDCNGDGTPCTVVFSLGSTAIQVEAEQHSIAVAKAILAQAR